jgi:hypothetical protein
MALSAVRPCRGRLGLALRFRFKNNGV